MAAGELPLVVELTPPPEIAHALRALADWPDVILFDSALQRDQLGRYSFLTADPFQLEELREIAAGPPPSGMASVSTQRTNSRRKRVVAPFPPRGGRAGEGGGVPGRRDGQTP
ncbi:MAG: hypothetical protein ACT4QC_10465, partial [Planctomycetaceae bacterium]